MGTTFSCMVVVEAINCLSTKTNSPNFIFVNYDFSTISKNELKNLLIFSKNFFRQISRSFILCVQRNNLTEYKVFLLKKSFFWQWVANLKAFRENFSTNCWNGSLRVKTNIFWIYIFSLSKLSSKSFLETTEKCRLSRENLQHDRQNCAPLLQMILWRDYIILFVQNCLFFAEFGIKFFSFLEKSFSRCVKGAFKVLREEFLGNIFFERKCFTFSDIAEKIGPPEEHPSTGLLKLCFTSPQKWTKKIFLS